MNSNRCTFVVLLNTDLCLHVPNYLNEILHEVLTGNRHEVLTADRGELDLRPQGWSYASKFPAHCCQDTEPVDSWSPCGQRSLIHGDCGVERKRRSGLVGSQGSELWRDSPSLLWVAPERKEYKLNTPLRRVWGNIYQLLLVMPAKHTHLPHSGEWKGLILAHSNGIIRSTVVLEMRQGLRHIALCYKHHIHLRFRHKHYQTRLKSTAAVTALG